MIPYQKWHSIDWLASSAARMLNYEEQGVYRALLDIAWKDGPVKNEEPPYLPDDPEKLAYKLGLPIDEFNRVWQKVALHFERDERGLRNERQMLEYEDAKAFIERQREAGKANKGKRKRGRKPRLTTANHGQPRLTKPEPNQTEPDHSYSHSQSNSNSSDEEEKKTPIQTTTTLPDNSKREPEVVVVDERQVKEFLKAPEARTKRMQPIGSMLGAADLDDDNPNRSVDALANVVLLAWRQFFPNGKARAPTNHQATQIADAHIKQAVGGEVASSVPRAIEILADEAREKRLDNPLGYYFGVLSKGGLATWLEKETKAEAKAKRDEAMAAAVRKGVEMERAKGAR